MIGWIQTIGKIVDEEEVSIATASLAIGDEDVETAETEVEETEAVATDEASLPVSTTIPSSASLPQSGNSSQV
jgi:hypothetical protein